MTAGIKAIRIDFNPTLNGFRSKSAIKNIVKAERTLKSGVMGLKESILKKDPKVGSSFSSGSFTVNNESY